MDILEDFLDKYDSLIIFLRFSRREIFDKVPENFLLWEVKNADPIRYDKYHEQVIHSSVILGFSYLENFLQEVIRRYYIRFPQALPQNRQIKYQEILAATSFEEIKEELINREINELFYKGIAEILEFLRTAWGYSIKDDVIKTIEEASLVRNCIIHNQSIVDRKLSIKFSYEKGSKLQLAEEYVHAAGITIRDFVESIFAQSKQKGIDCSL